LHSASGGLTATRAWPYAIAIVLLVGLFLRLQHIHDPLLDHPNWRQGDTASIARNFAQLQYNILYPQTDYNGPPPNYVELELQVLPFLAATLYKMFGVHAIFGRLLAVAFSLGTIALVAFFARRLYDSAIAGIAAATFFAVFPGSVYYGRTFTPDVVMVLFLTAALYASFEFLGGPSTALANARDTQDGKLEPLPVTWATLLLTLAYLAKPVAVLASLPLAGMILQRSRYRRISWRDVAAYAALLVVPLLILWLYDRAVNAHAEWHWASGITTLHVLPALAASFSGLHAFAHKINLFFGALGLLRLTMLGNIAFALTILACAAIPWTRPRSSILLWGWLVAGLLYAFVVVTVERVDYYLFPLLPFAALVIGGAVAWGIGRIGGWAAPVFAGFLALAVLLDGHAAVARYYRYDRVAYANAVLLSRTLPPRTLVVMGHYGPDVLYYIDRFGWEEDPLLWTPFDEESAIRKGARYYISVEDNRLRANADLCAWLQRFPVRRIGTWPVYETDPVLVSRGAEPFWDAFRRADRAGKGRVFLNAHHVCMKSLRRPLVSRDALRGETNLRAGVAAIRT
jgi:4-amino-4-deoxy-L-arabinose transferase-like glycosyltransferase